MQLGINEQLCTAIERLGWQMPTKIQQKCLGPALKNRDLIALAETGSGKTAAFALPILQALMEKPQKLFALVLAPTRELAFQITEQFEALGSSIGLTVATIIGGIEMATQTLSLGKRPHVVVATPGRLVDHLESTKGFNLKTLKYLVFDEADRLLAERDFEVELEKVLRAVPKDRITYLFSATMTKKVSKLERVCLRDPVRVELSTKYHTVDTLIQHLIFIPYKYKEAYLAHYLMEKAGNTIIVFCGRRADAVKLSLMLRELGLSAVALHGQMSQPTRIGALNKFKKKDRTILVCTDVASRGLDMYVDSVVNYDLPSQPKDYIHRVGRTARAGRAGNSLTIVTQYDVEQYQRIEQSIGKKLPVLKMNDNEAIQLAERVSEAARNAARRYKEIEGSQGGKRKLREAIEDEAPSRKHTRAEIMGGRKKRR